MKERRKVERLDELTSDYQDLSASVEPLPEAQQVSPYEGTAVHHVAGLVRHLSQVWRGRSDASCLTGIVAVVALASYGGLNVEGWIP